MIRMSRLRGRSLLQAAYYPEYHEEDMCLFIGLALA
jgi:hypothetical protein